MSLGGGAVPLTADLFARAVIAAARSYGDDPVRALEVDRGRTRRCLAPAAAGICRATGASMARVSRIMGVRANNIARAKEADGFQLASMAAERAAKFATWRPESRASVVGGAAAYIAPMAAPPLGPVNGVRMLTAKAAERAVLGSLGVLPATGVELMARLQLGEGQVRQALQDLAACCRIEVLPGSLAGWRSRAWKVAS